MVTTFRNDQRRPGVLRHPADNARPTGSHRKPAQRGSRVVDERPFDRVGALLRREGVQLGSDAERALLGSNCGWRSNGPAMRLGSIMAGAVLACAGTIGAGITFGVGGPAALPTTTPERPVLATETREGAPADVVSLRAVPPIVPTTPTQPPAPRPAAEPAAGRPSGEPATRVRADPVAAQAGFRPTPPASPALAPQPPADRSSSPAAPTTPPDAAAAGPPTVADGPPALPPGVVPVEDTDPEATSPLHRERIGTGSGALPTPPPGYTDAESDPDADLDVGALTPRQRGSWRNQI